MNKKNIVKKENIEKIAKYLEDACNWFKEDKDGCWNFKLSTDLTLAVGWSDGYNMADTDIIKSKQGQKANGNWVCGYAVNAAVKVRNDCDCSEYDYLNFPYYPDTGECWDCGISMSPDLKRRDYRRLARWFLESFVSITNAYKKGEICYE